MSEKFIRIYQKYDVSAIKPNLLIYGEISGSCANCNKIDLKLNDQSCPECHADFYYIAFRSVKSHLPKLEKLVANRPNLKIIDYEDYNKQINASKAQDFFK